MASITARQAYGHRKAWDVHVLHQEPESFHSSGKETVHVHHCKATARLSQWSRSRKAQLREAMEDSSLHSTAPKWGELGRNIQKLNRVLQIFRVFQQNLLYFQRICRANAVFSPWRRRKSGEEDGIHLPSKTHSGWSMSLINLLTYFPRKYIFNSK